ncbi:MAG TPA: zinc ribbon domain-containing protein [Solirubrobacterales bacterium]
MSESGAPTGETEVTMPSLGKPGEPCEQCGTPLAADQRYCLNCGKRRGAPRVDYRALAPAGAPAAKPASNGAEKPAAEEKAEPAKTERDYAPLAAVGGIAILGLMLLVGVLIGRGDGDSSPAPAPVVLEGGSAQGGSETASGSGSKSGGGGLTGGGGNSGAADQKAKSTPQEEAAKEGAVEASSEDLEALENETGEDAAKNALKLPDKIATPGTPPPIDKSVAPGAGEGGETIE